MEIQQVVIEELRSMFKDGATPSRLIQHIVARHPPRGNWHGLIQDYFREGFGVPIVRGLAPGENYHDIGIRYAFLNQDLLYEMVRSRSMWDKESLQPGNAGPTWLDALDRIQDTKQAGPPPDMAESWDKLGERERNLLALSNSSHKSKSEQIRILACLVERLQQRLAEQEKANAEEVANAARTY